MRKRDKNGTKPLPCYRARPEYEKSVRHGQKRTFCRVRIFIGWLNRRTSGPNTSSSLARSCTMNCCLRKRAHFQLISDSVSVAQDCAEAINQRSRNIVEANSREKARLASKRVAKFAAEPRLACDGISMRQFCRFSRKIRSTQK
jgi:hypothetical protein